MKNKKLKTFVILVATLCGFISNTRAGTFQSITIDGNFADWSGVPLLYTDPLDSATNGSTADYANVYLANDASYLYVRFSVYVATNLFVSRQNFFFDSDNTTATGYQIHGNGSEMLIQSGTGFQEKNGAFNEGAIIGLDFARSPAVLGPEFEFRVSRNATYASDGLPVFVNNTITFLMEAENQARTPVEFAPDTGGFTYTFAAVPEPSPLSLLAFGSVCLFATVGITERRAKAARASKPEIS